MSIQNEKFGKLTAIRNIDINTRRTSTARWLCACDCGGSKIVDEYSLKKGNCKSCGCLKKEMDSINLRKNKNNQKYKNKNVNKRIYSIWLGMRQRCSNENNHRYERYGCRGIKVCKCWDSDFIAFQNWALKNGYLEGLTIERIDNNGDYEPNNCTWATAKEQANNRHTNVVFEVNGKKMNLTDIAKAYSLPYSTVNSRYLAGDSLERIIRPLGEDRKSAKGSSNKMSKITEKQALEIKKRIKDGESAISISMEMNISKYIVYGIKQGKTWNWI